MKSVVFLFVVLLTLGSSACAVLNRTAHFPFSVSNRNVNTIQVYADGVEYGVVKEGYPESFEIQMTVRRGSSSAPTETIQVTITARDARTGKLSKAKTLRLTEDQSRNVEFDADDFK